MNLKTITSQFMELCTRGRKFDVMHMMYSPDIVSVEASGEVTACKVPVIRKSEHWRANNTIHQENVRGPFLNGPDQFAVHFTFEVTPKGTGWRTMLEKVGIYTVKDGKITREQFFEHHDPMREIAISANILSLLSTPEGNSHVYFNPNP